MSVDRSLRTNGRYSDQLKTLVSNKKTDEAARHNIQTDFTYTNKGQKTQNTKE